MIYPELPVWSPWSRTSTLVMLGIDPDQPPPPIIGPDDPRYDPEHPAHSPLSRASRLAFTPHAAYTYAFALTDNFLRAAFPPSVIEKAEVPARKSFWDVTHYRMDTPSRTRAHALRALLDTVAVMDHTHLVTPHNPYTPEEILNDHPVPLPRVSHSFVYLFMVQAMLSGSPAYAAHSCTLAFTLGSASLNTEFSRHTYEAARRVCYRTLLIVLRYYAIVNPGKPLPYEQVSSAQFQKGPQNDHDRDDPDPDRD